MKKQKRNLFVLKAGYEPSLYEEQDFPVAKEKVFERILRPFWQGVPLCGTKTAETSESSAGGTRMSENTFSFATSEESVKTNKFLFCF